MNRNSAPGDSNILKKDNDFEQKWTANIFLESRIQMITKYENFQTV